MSKEQHYLDFVKGKTAEDILAHGGGAITGPIGEYIRVAATVRTNQELISALDRASADNTRLARRLVWLTAVLAIIGLAQTIAIAWPFLVYSLKHEGLFAALAFAFHNCLQVYPNSAAAIRNVFA